MASARAGSVVNATTSLQADEVVPSDPQEANRRLRHQVEAMQQLLQKGEDRRRAMLHIMVDMNDANRRLADQRKAMLHILGDYELGFVHIDRRSGGERQGVGEA